MIDRFGYFKISDMSGSMGPSAAELDKSSTPVTMGGTDWLAAGRLLHRIHAQALLDITELPTIEVLDD